MKNNFQLKKLFAVILVCSIFTGCQEGCEQMQRSSEGYAPAAPKRTVKPTTIERMGVYDRPILFSKEFSVVGIVVIKPEKPIDTVSSSGFYELIDPINLRLMEEAKKIGAHDIIDVRIEKLPDGNWVVATALAIKYEKGFYDGGNPVNQYKPASEG